MPLYLIKKKGLTHSLGKMPYYGTSLLLAILLLLMPVSSSYSFLPTCIIKQEQDVIHYQRREGILPAPSLSGNLVGCSTEQPYVVFLPPIYDNTTNEFPTVYFLHGFSTSVTSFRNTFLSLDYPVDMIVVIVNGRTIVGGSFYENSEVTGHWEDYIVKDVVSFIDGHFRTIKNASCRGISGLSMGGYAALNIAMKHPDVFGSVFAISPGLFDPDGIKESQLYSSYCIDYILNLETELLAQDNHSAAHSLYLERLNELSFSDDRRFALAYGSAFAPNANKIAPYIDYLFYKNASGTCENQTSRLLWESGFGGIQEEIEEYQNELRNLKGIGIEYSDLDTHNWIPKGCRYYQKTLELFNITLNISNTTYGHANYLSQRIQEYMLPFFGDIFQSSTNNQSIDTLDNFTIEIIITFTFVVALVVILADFRRRMNTLSVSPIKLLTL